MIILETKLPGCYEITPIVHNDSRGSFIKTFQTQMYLASGLTMECIEEYFTVSKEGVIRGLHFQIPPQEHCKMVYCTHGEAFDVVLDIRNGSPTFGMYETFKLSGSSGKVIFIPSGMAHGFCALTDYTVMNYKVSSIYSQNHDSGIRWDSIGIPWPVKEPTISKRDRSFLPLSSFDSPFDYQRL